MMKSTTRNWLSSRFFLTSCAFLAFACGSRGDDGGAFYLKDGDKVVFYGDSITEQRLYTTFAETFVLTRFPKLKIDFVHSGWGGDTVNGGGGGPIDLRLSRDVFAYQPTVVTIMLGMNDGGYRSPDAGVTATYEKGYEHILDSLQTKLPGVRLTLIQPSAYDDVTCAPNFPGGYNAVLQNFSQFIRTEAVKYKQNTADFNTPMVDVMTKAKAADANLATNIIPGRVHPSPAGHLIMAEALVKSWNAPATVSDVEIDAAGQKIVRADNSKVDDLKFGDTITWTETDDSLPMPTHPVAADDPLNKVIDLVLASSDFIDALDREPLRVTGLKAPYYELNIDDDSVGVFSREDLEKGINLATLHTPMMEQASQVHQLTVQHDNMHAERWRSFQVPLMSKNVDAITNALPPILAALDAEEAKVVEQQRATAQPVPREYELTPQDSAIAKAAVVPPDPVLPTGIGPNLALNKNYVSDSPNTYGWSTGLTDGSWAAGQGSTWASNDSPVFPKSVTIDLEKPELVANILVGVPPFGATKKVKVSLSTDNQTFTPVGAYSFPQNAAVKHLYTVAPTTARYVRLTYLNHYDQSQQYGPYFVFATEVEVYGPAPK
jgi:lysophospholipase L1-like esterase